MKTSFIKKHFKFLSKLIIDIIMAGIFICLTKIKITGMHLHEVFGCVLGIVVLVHILLNRKWIKGVTIKIFHKKTDMRMKILYGINVLLLISFFVALISGILVSVTILRKIYITHRELWAIIHRKSALLTFILIIVHGIMNYKMMKAYCINIHRKIIKG